MHCILAIPCLPQLTGGHGKKSVSWSSPGATLLYTNCQENPQLAPEYKGLRRLKITFVLSFSTVPVLSIGTALNRATPTSSPSLFPPAPFWYLSLLESFLCASYTKVRLGLGPGCGSGEVAGLKALPMIPSYTYCL